jgi:hypothetical protein
VFKRAKTVHALDGSATEIGDLFSTEQQIIIGLFLTQQRRAGRIWMRNGFSTLLSSTFDISVKYIAYFIDRIATKFVLNLRRGLFNVLIH